MNDTPSKFDYLIHKDEPIIHETIANDRDKEVQSNLNSNATITR